MDYAYRNYVPKLTDQMTAALKSIEAVHNFELGDEFEIALCRVLRLALPDQYGICRGYVTSVAGDIAGDDIIIFERTRFPSLRFQLADDFSRKEYVPVEAVYAYIEAKFTLNLFGDDGQSIAKAAAQVAAVKSLISKREKYMFGELDPYVPLPFRSKPPEHLPAVRNPPFAAVFAAAARLREGGPREHVAKTISPALDGSILQQEYSADLIVVGSNLVLLPALAPADRREEWLLTTFFLPERSRYRRLDTEGQAFGIALASLMSALDWIRLGRMPWHLVIGDALGIETPGATA